MNEEAGFIAAMAAQPDEDLPRLAFADWLDEHDRPDEAELIRVQCELEPIRDRHGDPQTDELHKLADTLYWAPRTAAINWFAELVGDKAHEIGIVFRRGFAEELHLPVQWVIEHGEAIREHFPLLRKLAVFRVNGWGERLAACEHLRGLRELDLGCWYSDADAEALARSPHLADLETLTYWAGNQQEDEVLQLRTLAGSKAWPKLHKLRVMLGRRMHVTIANAAAGRSIAEAIDPNEWLFPFRPDFGDGGYFIGTLLNGAQVFCGDADDSGSARAVFFDAAGNVAVEQELTFPPETLAPRNRQLSGTANRWRDEEQRAKREEHLRDTLGFEPAFIRVREFSIGAEGPSRYRERVENLIGYIDQPEVRPEHDYDGILGPGRCVYDWVTTGAFRFTRSDEWHNEWWCDERGRVTST